MRIMASINSPCRDCENRTITCHDNCELYFDYKKQIEFYNKKVAEQQRLDDLVSKKRWHS